MILNCSGPNVKLRNCHLPCLVQLRLIERQRYCRRVRRRIIKGRSCQWNRVDVSRLAEVHQRQVGVRDIQRIIKCDRHLTRTLIQRGRHEHRRRVSQFQYLDGVVVRGGCQCVDAASGLKGGYGTGAFKFQRARIPQASYSGRTMRVADIYNLDGVVYVGGDQRIDSSVGPKCVYASGAVKFHGASALQLSGSRRIVGISYVDDLKTAFGS